MMSRGCSSVGDVGGNDLVAEWRNRDVNRARWVGLGWVGLGWVGLGWVGVGWVGSGRVVW